MDEQSFPDSNLNQNQTPLNQNLEQKVEGSTVEEGIQGIQGNDNTQVQGNNNWIFKFIFNKGSNRQKKVKIETLSSRQILLNKVKNAWIKGVLENSLHQNALIELGLEQRLDEVNQPWGMVWETSEQLKQILPSGTKVIDKFNELGKGRTLLILGNPGAGKTTTLLELARDLITYAEQDITLPIPVVLNLSSWESRKQNQKIADWVVQELKRCYEVSEELAKNLMQQEQLLLLLDGLDEVKENRRYDCVQYLNQFHERHGNMEIVVCSRFQQYDALLNRLSFQSAIYLQDLSFEQVENYLGELGEKLAGLKIILKSSSTWQELVKTPLLLSIIISVYEEEIKSIKNPSQVKSIENESDLFDFYIERMFSRRQTLSSNNPNKYLKSKSINWLIILAQMMHKENQTIFYIEQMQVSWIQSSIGRWIYYIFVLQIICFYVGLILIPYIWHFRFDQNQFSVLKGLFFVPFAIIFFGIINGIFSAIFYQTINKKMEKLDIPLIIKSIIKSIIYGFVPALTFSIFIRILTYEKNLLATFLFFYPCFGVAFLIFTEIISFGINPVEKLKWSRERFKSNLSIAIIFVFLLAIIYHIRNFIIWKVPDYDSLIKLIFMSLIIGISFVIFNGFQKGVEIEEKTMPNIGILKSAENAIFFTIISAVSGGISFFIWALFSKFLPKNISFMIGFIVGLIAGGLIFGQGSGIVCIQHFILRVILYLNNRIPWNYADFLNYASERIFLQKVGGGYIFMHRMLLKHFASLPREKLKI